MSPEKKPDNFLSKNVLVVDDKPQNLQLLTSLLTENHYQVFVATQAQRALEICENFTPDLFLLDILMPEMDGYQLCEKIKAQPRLKEIPVIFISALDEIFDKLKAFKVGGIDYITKPFQTEEVLARVHVHLSNHQYQRALQQKNEELAISNQELDAFAHTIAHDLKNPLNTISMLVDMFVTNPKLAENHADKLKTSTLKAASIIDNLLLLAGIRKEGVNWVRFSMADPVKLALEQIKPLIDKYNPKIEIPQDWPNLISYPAWIEQIWVNYISNAIKYAGQAPILKLGWETLPDNYFRFWIQDNGKGLSPEELGRLFTEFERLNQVHIAGHGLGLSIVQRIAQKLGGKVGAESSLGEGSRFYFILPQNP